MLSLPTAHAAALTSLRAAEAALRTEPVVTFERLCARNVALVHAVKAGVPEALVAESTGLRDAALELALARGQFCAELSTR
ncbi:hypothetical protein [Georgenia thermotolerans]|uniref:Uncharacterized protein n=1 Tax=Georgenia thermotolerans TaxID=527326 RepID=A0A7J5UMT3_9MICO|nr:hypothetical protein [Georgenia thermotolerans]KAE8763696.1 hypothetical protein GB883_12825 [Georgenia thermotolerans]